MKVLVIGAGAREHALLQTLLQSPQVTQAICAPGNAGIAQIARCEPLDVANPEAIQRLATREHPDLVVIGPEIPLAAGAVDTLQSAGIAVFGPTRAAAMLETSKAFAKQFMARWHIPTAAYALCTSEAEVAAALNTFPQQVVVKADGLAAGKGVLLCETHAEALTAAQALFSGSLGIPVESIILEEMLEGPEISYFAICDGHRAVTLGFAQDHKRVGGGDTGPNTGGMGAYSTDTLVPPQTADWMLTEVAQRVVNGMRAERTPFTGVLFTGFMLTPQGPKVLEFNTRFGDPETEALLLRLDTDLYTLLEAATQGRLAEGPIALKPGAAACVIAASAGYPGKYTQGHPITGLENTPPDVQVFHAGTAQHEHQLVTAGGRVLAIAAAAPTLPEALANCYTALKEIHFEGMHYRRDIGWRAETAD